MNENSFIFWLSIMANACQLESYEMLVHDAKNNELMQYLQHQDNDYLKAIIKQNEKIIQQNQEIIDFLKGGTQNENRTLY